MNVCENYFRQKWFSFIDVELFSASASEWRKYDEQLHSWKVASWCWCNHVNWLKLGIFLRLDKGTICTLRDAESNFHHETRRTSEKLRNYLAACLENVKNLRVASALISFQEAVAKHREDDEEKDILRWWVTKNKTRRNIKTTSWCWSLSISCIDYFWSEFSFNCASGISSHERGIRKRRRRSLRNVMCVHVYNSVQETKNKLKINLAMITPFQK